jgi:2-phosphoglycolate phosphatase
MADKIRLIIFDLDGTLVDAYPAIIQSFNYALQKKGYPPQDKQLIRQSVGWGDANLLKPFLKKADLKATVAIYRRHHRRALLKLSRLFPGAGQLLRQLKNKGYQLAVASNRPTRFSLILIRHLKIERYFSYLLCADRLKHGKPHPEILKRIMTKFAVSPKQTLYVGDMHIDAQAGRRAKIKTVIVTTGSSTRAQVLKQKPWRIIRRIKDLLPLLG